MLIYVYIYIAKTHMKVSTCKEHPICLKYFFLKSNRSSLPLSNTVINFFNPDRLPVEKHFFPESGSPLLWNGGWMRHTSPTYLHIHTHFLSPDLQNNKDTPELGMEAQISNPCTPELGMKDTSPTPALI